MNSFVSYSNPEIDHFLELSASELFDELSRTCTSFGCDKGIIFQASTVQIAVNFDNDDLAELARAWSYEPFCSLDETAQAEDPIEHERLKAEALADFYQLHEDEIDRHFFIDQIDDIRLGLEKFREEW